MWHSRHPRDPPPLHGKCHLKFPFWLLAHLPYLFFLFLHPVRLQFSILATGRLNIFLSFFACWSSWYCLFYYPFYSWPWCSSRDHGTSWCNTSAAEFDHRSGATNKEPVIKDYDDDVNVLVVILMVMMMTCGCCGCWFQKPTLFLGL